MVSVGSFILSKTLTLGQIVQLTGGKPSTLKLRLRELVASGHLLPKGQGRGAYYLRARRPQRGGSKNVSQLSQLAASSYLGRPQHSVFTVVREGFETPS